MKRIKEPSEIVYERHSKQAVPHLRRMLRQLGVWTVVGLLREITLKDRARISREQPDALPQLDFEYATALELATAIEIENTVNWPQRPKKKTKK